MRHRKSSPLDVIRAHLPLLTWVNITKPVQNLHYAAKLIVRPHRIMDLYVHHVMGFYGNYTNILPNPYEEIFIHHFKNATTMRPYWRDNIPGHFYRIQYPDSLTNAALLEKITVNVAQGFMVVCKELNCTHAWP